MAHWVLPKVEPVDHSPVGPALYFLDKITPRMKKRKKAVQKSKAIQKSRAIQKTGRGDTKEGEIRKTIEKTIKGDDQEKTIKRSLLVDCKHNDPERARKDLHSNSKKPAEASNTQEYDSNSDTPDEIKTPIAQAHVHEKCDEVVVKVIKSYDESTKSFRLGDKKVKLKDNHVKLIFGISCGNEEMTETNISKQDTALAKRLGIKEARLTTTTMKEKIKELKSSKKPEDIDDVVRLLCLFLCVTLLFSTSGTMVNWSFVHYMEDLAKFWLCEHTKLLTQKNADAVPRLLKWNVSELRDLLRDFDHLNQLPADQVSDTKLRETDKERKIYSNLGSEQEGGEVEALEPEVENVRMTVDGESPKQVEVSTEERVEKGATQVNADFTSD
ncbi:hypothetical protein RHMOL_Rhmol09G0093400 [Rhododendron molle]|uniref:Uncharacterized protein n=1 Tax=Rhododendron molle TaxID=49168 RepID=A0ACC0MBU9_RHOML|nr:hypothetical protein RHMOL_Rhmol09G0093400 [Rhododendron molle]